MPSTTHNAECAVLARGLLEDLAKSVTNGDGVCTMSTAVYDTAWVSMVSKEDGDSRRWLLPGSFDYIVRSQQENGGWSSEGPIFDDVLNSTAALLAMRFHAARAEYRGCHGLDFADLDDRMTRASQHILAQLQSLPALSDLPVGFEILLPSLLRQLEAYGTSYDFPAKARLLALEEKKLGGFPVEYLYQPKQCTAIHSLEAFVGKIDFGKVRHHLVNGAMMNSPAATAAYLMHTPTWDDAAEAYLRKTVRGDAFPSASLSTTFEISWAWSTLLEAGFSVEELGQQTCAVFAEYMEGQLRDGNGVVGFAPGIMPDTDDTAKSLESLILAGGIPDIEGLVSTFERPGHFATYAKERDPSMSANCNVLVTLLHASEDPRYLPQIAKALTFLCDRWDRGEATDKWNTSRYYTVMRLVHALVLLLEKWDNRKWNMVDVSLLEHRAPLLLVQAMVQLLSEQHDDGSWGCLEESAYALSAVKALSSLPWFAQVEDEVNTATRRATDHLWSNRDKWSDGASIWTEKVSYKSPVLSQAYCIAAVYASSQRCWTERVASIGNINAYSKEMRKLQGLFASLPKFSETAPWIIELSMLESWLFVPKLQAARLDVFPYERLDLPQFRYIPISWVAVNNAQNHSARLNNIQLWDMMAKSLLAYQVDMYVETVVDGLSSTDTIALKSYIRSRPSSNSTPEGTLKRARDEPDDEVKSVKRARLDTPDSLESCGQCCEAASEEQSVTKSSLPLETARTTLAAFVNHSMDHASVLAASTTRQQQLRCEIGEFLCAQIDSTADNAELAAQRSAKAARNKDSSPSVKDLVDGFGSEESFFVWLHGRAAIHTSCPYTLTFFSIIASPGTDGLFDTPVRAHFAENLKRHLAAACRLYNDFGSVTRDRKECNLNAVNWLGDGVRTDDAKATVLKLARYEDAAWQLAMASLKEELDDRAFSKLQIFVDVTDLYAQMYVARDLTQPARAS